MKMVIGGAFQGKTKAAGKLFGLNISDFADGETCPLEEIYECRALFHFHLYIRRLLETEKKDIPENFVEKLFSKNPDIVLVTTELGYGIVPMDPFDRFYREKVGRICCHAAQKASEVYRVAAGIPVCIKGDQI